MDEMQRRPCNCLNPRFEDKRRLASMELLHQPAMKEKLAAYGHFCRCADCGRDIEYQCNICDELIERIDLTKILEDL